MRLKSSIIKQLIKEELQNFLQEQHPPASAGGIKVSNKPTSEKTKAAIKGEKTETETPEAKEPTEQECLSGIAPKWQCKAAGYTHAEDKEEKKTEKDPKQKKMSFKDTKAACAKGDQAACARKKEMIKRYRRRQKKKKGLAKKGAPETQGAQAKQPTRQQRMLAIKLLRALIQLQRHPQFQKILSAVKKAAAGGHPIARIALDAVKIPYDTQESTRQRTLRQVQEPARGAKR